MVSDRCVQGIGLSLPGRIDPATLQLNFPPRICSGRGSILKAAIERAIPLYVELENAANACMLSELWFGRMDGVRDAVLLTISEGIGTSTLADGRLVSGHYGLAGEFGHSRFVRDGLMCGCGRKGSGKCMHLAERLYATLTSHNPTLHCQTFTISFAVRKSEISKGRGR